MPDRFREYKLWKPPRMVGILPEMMFQDKSMICNIFNALMFAWRLPLSELNDKSKKWRFSRIHELEGIDEDNELEVRSKVCKLVRFPMQFGIDPDSLLLWRPISPKFVRQISIGMLCPS